MAALRLVRDEDLPPPTVPQPYAQMYFPELAGWYLVVTTGCARPPAPRGHRRRRTLLSLALLDYRAHDSDEIPRPVVPERSGPRPKSFGMKPLSRRERKNLQQAEYELRRDGKLVRLRLRRLPVYWAACEGFDGPCPLYSCRHHMGSDITEAGALKLIWPGRSPEEMPGTCSLRLADQAPEGGWNHEEISRFTNVVSERIRQIEASAMRKFAAAAPELAEALGIRPRGNFSPAGTRGQD